MRIARPFIMAPLLLLALGPDPSEAAQGRSGEGGDAAVIPEPGGGPPPLAGSLRKRLHAHLSADADRDGLVTSAEAEAYFEARFDAMDADRDGRLNGSEFVRLGMAKRHGAGIAGLRTGRFPKFEHLDIDGDGSVSPEEFAFEMRSRRAASAAWAEKERERREAMFARLDADGVGSVGRSSFVAAGTGWFEAIDLDGDGEVSVWEFLSGPRL